MTTAHADGYDDFNTGLAEGIHDDAYAAIAALTRALAAPDFPAHLRVTAYLARGESNANVKQYEAAVADYTEALKLRPDNLRILIDRAAAYQESHRYAEALADENTAIRLRPYNTGAYYQRMATNAALGHYADEIADCDTLLAYWPGDKPFILAQRSDVYLHMGQYAQAEADADAAIDANSKFISAYMARGRARALADALDRARSDFDDALDHDENDVDALESRGFVAWDLGKYDRAADDFHAAMKQDSSDGYAALGLQLAKFKLGGADDGELAAAAAKLDLKAWPGPLIAFYLGRLDEHELTRAATGDSPIEQARRSCEVEFYLGEWKLAHADATAGMALIQKVVSDCPPDVLEQESARVELKRRQAAESRP